MLKSFIKCKITIIEKLEIFTQPFVLLAARLYMANIFFASGWLKLQSYLNDQWDTTLLLFEHEHPVPYLSPQLAAFLGTAGEILFPALLALGLATRFGAVGLLFMTAIIEFTYKSLEVHQFWALLLLIPLAFGAGRISIDHYIKKHFANQN